MNSETTRLNPRACVLVTGANGFLGRHVSLLFSRRGHTVLGIGHGEWRREDWESWGLSGWRRANVTLHELKRYEEIPSVIVHCAGGGSVAFSIENPLSDFERTVETTAHVLEYARTVAPSCRIVYPSSASVYGCVKQLPIREDCPVAPISQYGAHKLMAEHLVGSYSRQFGTSATIVRLFSVYGPELRKQLLWDACRKFANRDHQFMGTGDEIRDWLHVEDASELLVTAAEHASPECPVVNGGSGKGITVREVLVHLGSCDLRFNSLPTFTGLQRPGDPTSYIADTEASMSWGWFPKISWEQGMREYAKWWLENSP